jgi:hypothetical protein
MVERQTHWESGSITGGSDYWEDLKALAQFAKTQTSEIWAPLRVATWTVCGCMKNNCVSCQPDRNTDMVKGTYYGRQKTS